MKHRILIEFTAATLPDYFLDQIAGRVYGHPAVDKKECIASFVGDVLKDAERWKKARNLHWTKGGLVVTDIKNVKLGAICLTEGLLDKAIDAAMKG